MDQPLLIGKSANSEGLPEKLVRNLAEFSFLKDATLNSAFIKETQKIVSFLNNVKAKFDYFDQSSPALGEQIAYIEENKKNIFEVIDKHFDAIWQIFEMLSAREYRVHQLFYQKEVLGFFHTPPLNKRIYDKPLGYDGDFIMMEYYYENGYHGRTTFEKLMHRYTLNIPVATATTERFDYIYRWMAEIIEKNEGEVKITSLGCGPAIEVVNYIKNNLVKNRVIFNLLDAEPKAIDHIVHKLMDFDLSARKFKVNFLNFDILKLIKASKKDQSLHRQDLIYAAGLFDYLNDKIATRLVEVAFNLLNDGGRLIISNFSKDSPHKAYLEMLGEWKLIYRDESDMMRLCSMLAGAKSKSVLKDKETGINFYLIVNK